MTFPRPWASILASTVALLCVAATPLDNSALRFRVTIPDGFEPDTQSPKRERDLYRYARPAGDASPSRVVVAISRLGGKLPTGVVVTARSENGVRVEPMATAWKAHTLVGSRATGGQGQVCLTVQVPLTPEAIMITVAGAADDEQQVSDALRSILASVEGDSNWVTEGGRATTKEGQEAQRLIGKDAFACAAVLVPAGIIFYLWRRGRRGSSGVA